MAKRASKTDTPHAIGSRFEGEVLNILVGAKSASNGVIDFTPKPNIAISEDLTLIPDFSLTIRIAGMSIQCFVECQDRKRSSHEIAQKIQTVRSKTSYSQFAFLYPRAVPATTRKWLHSVGANCMTSREFERFLRLVNEQANQLQAAPDITPMFDVKWLVSQPPDNRSSLAQLIYTNAYAASGALRWATR
jgi:hypothetical protein